VPTIGHKVRFVSVIRQWPFPFTRFVARGLASFFPTFYSRATQLVTPLYGQQPPQHHLAPRWIADPSGPPGGEKPSRSVYRTVFPGRILPFLLTVQFISVFCVPRGLVEQGNFLPRRDRSVGPYCGKVLIRVPVGLHMVWLVHDSPFSFRLSGPDGFLHARCPKVLVLALKEKLTVSFFFFPAPGCLYKPCPGLARHKRGPSGMYPWLGRSPLLPPGDRVGLETSNSTASWCSPVTQHPGSLPRRPRIPTFLTLLGQGSFFLFSSRCGVIASCFSSLNPGLFFMFRAPQKNVFPAPPAPGFLFSILVFF